MIMLEGPDLVGKTTTANALKKILRGSYVVHRGPPVSSDPFVEYLRPLEEAYHASEFPILDRWHWGELIYGPLLRGSSLIDPVQHEYLEMACMRYGVSRLLLLTPYGELLQRFDRRGDDLVGREQLIHLAAEYQRIAVSTNFSVHHFFERVEPFSRAELAWIVAEAMTYRGRANLLAEWPSYVGPVEPAVLFIGEKPAETHRGKFKTAFVPYRGTSGHHLLACLREVNFRAYHATSPDLWTSFGLANAYDGCENAHDLWCRLGYPVVVALGRLAHEAIHRFDIPHGRAPHPQFARRFHNKKRESYGRALLAAAELEDVSKWKG
jgi:hypothetical protein